MIKGLPMTPAEIDAMTPVPPEVFDAVNELLSRTERNYAGELKILQDDIVTTTWEKMKVSTGESVEFDYKWLNIQNHYMQIGWIVRYKKPTHNESRDAFFIFKTKQ